MKKFEYYIEKIADRFNVVAAAAVVLIMLVIVFDITMRLFRISVPGAYDLISLLGAVVIAFSLTYTSIQQGHIAVDFLYQKVPERFRPVFDIFNTLSGSLFFGVLGWQCLVYGASLKTAGEVSLTIKIPTYPFLWGIGVSCFLLSTYLFLNLVNSIKGAVRR